MNLSDFFTNPWVVGTSVTVVGGLILHYVFGVGKTKDKKGTSYNKSPHISAKGNISAGRDIVVGRPTTKTKKKELKKQLTLDFAERKVSWANYAVGRWVWPSFRIILSINNFNNTSPEYLKAYLIAKSIDGKWEAKNFMFLNRENENKSRPNEDFRIEPGYKEKVSLFISNHDIGLREQKPIPNIDTDTLKLIIETESGKTITLPIKAGWISKG